MPMLTVFLGNPGKQYAKTRHNVAWRLLESLEPRWAPGWQQKFNGRFAQISPVVGAAGGAGGGGTSVADGVVLLVPETFMNRSGDSVQPCARYFRIPPERIIVVHDDTEISFGEIGMKRGGGLGGNNGLKSTAERLGSRDFYRLRIGVSRPRHGSLSSHVLGKFTAEEEGELDSILRAAGDLLEEAWREGPSERQRVPIRSS